MATGRNIRTWFEGRWHEGDVAVMRAADHGSWLGTTVFDGARWFEGVAPDLDRHMARVNRSAEALMITPTMTAEAMVEIAREGLATYPKGAAVYIRPMYWALDGDATGVVPEPGGTGFALCLEEIPMAPEGATTTLTTTRFVPICKTLPADTSPSKSVPAPTTAVALDVTVTVPARSLVDDATGAAKPVEFVKAIQTDRASGPVWTVMP